MESTLPIIITLILGFATIIFFINKKISQNQTDQNLVSWLKSMQESMERSTSTVNTSLMQNSQALNERLENATKVISTVQKEIAQMSEIGKSMKELQDFLRSPKLRGNMGEQILKELLGQMLPKSSFHLQYAFKNGTIVDAAIKTEAGIIPVDSKFPLEAYRKMQGAQDDSEKLVAEKQFISDVKKHVDSISKKYILPSEGTIDYALMYVPSESVYYEMINHVALYEYASTKRVLPVSPMTFYAYLRAIMMGFEGQKISQKAHEILQSLKAIQSDYQKVDDHLMTLSKHINNSSNMMSEVQSGFGKLGQKITATNRLQMEEDDLLVEKITR
ncbi:MAG TPA: DNA recombination protein RmuC [Candidatus Levybacteria bacterium]|nr:DNA recombination protein RmuC [Candidatus Levybacteria bacterium]